MGAVWMRGRAELRSRWKALMVLALLIGIGGGVALTSLAGSRRTDRAVTQFGTYSRPDHGGFTYGSVLNPPVDPALGAGLAPLEQRVVDLPQVAAWFRLPEVDLATDPTGRSSSGLDVMASPDAAFMRTVDRPLMVAGRLPAVDRPFDVAVNELAAKQLHLRVGRALHLYAYSAGQMQSMAHTGGGPYSTAPAGPAPAGPALNLHISGIFRLPADVNAVEPYVARQDISYEGRQEIYLPPSFLPRLASRLGMPVQRFPYLNLVAVRLRHGLADFPAYAAAAVKAGEGQVFVGDPTNVVGTATAVKSASGATRVQAWSLLVFGLLALAITVALVGQGLSRQVLLPARERATMRAIGASRGQLAATALVSAGLTALVGAVLALVVAVAASPLMPIGLARQAEINPGVDVDTAILVGGAGVLALLMTLWCAAPAWRAGAAVGPDPLPAATARIPVLAGGLARMLRSPSAGMGVRFALSRGAGGRALPVVSALVAAVLAVAGLAASLTFGSSLSHLGSDARQQGWNWDVLVGNPNDFTNREDQFAGILASDRLVGSYSAVAVIAGARQGNAYIGKVSLDTFLAYDQLRGSVHPVLLSGREPAGPDELVLGARTLAKLHKRVGDTVKEDVGPPVGTLTLRIVGAMIAPSVGDIFTNSLGDGAWIDGSAFKAIQAQMPADPGASGPPQSTFGLFAVRFAPGVPPTAGYASLRRQFGPIVLRRLPPEDVINLHSVQDLPLILAGLVGLLGLATVGHTLVTSVRGRRHDLAVLKTMGFRQGQVAATVAWQATSFMLAAEVVGLPLGIAAGRWSWHVAASAISSTSPVAMPALALLLILPGGLLAANLMAAGPGWMAARVAPAVILRED